MRGVIAPSGTTAAAAPELARETLRQLAVRRLAPTPANYGRVYAELGGESEIAAAAPDAEALLFLREQLARTLMLAVVPRLGHGEELARSAREIARGLREARDLPALRVQAAALKAFWLDLELRGETQADVLAAALALLQLVVRNLGEFSVADDGMEAQLERVRAALSEPAGLKPLREAEQGLRGVIVRQSSLKARLDEATVAARQMASVMIKRLEDMSTSTGAFSDRVGSYAARMEAAGSLPHLAELMTQLLADTRGVQADMMRSRDELAEARKRVQAAEQHVATLQRELESVSGLVREDALTGTLNRRGLDEAFGVESARCDRRAAPISVAVLDLDNFKLLNDSLGHQAGDAALVHLARIVRGALRPSDVVARFGGEEFVILLPETALAEAVQVMVRVQRELTKRFFLHNNERVLITFSAGVAERKSTEPQQALIERADRAMYQAKRSGKNRVDSAG